MDEELNMLTSHDQEAEIYRKLRFSSSPNAIARLPSHIRARAFVTVKLWYAADCDDDRNETRFEAIRNEFEKLLRDGVIAECISDPKRE